MKHIRKYVMAFAMEDFQIPKERSLLHVGKNTQDERPAIWFEIKTESENEKVTFEIFPTGTNPTEKHSFVGTAICGSYVWHIYKVL